MKSKLSKQSKTSIIIAQICIDQSRKHLTMIKRYSFLEANITLNKAIFFMRVAYKFNSQKRFKLSIAYANKSINRSIDAMQTKKIKRRNNDNQER